MAVIRSVIRGVGAHLPKRVHDQRRPRQNRRYYRRVDPGAHRHQAAPHRRRTASSPPILGPPRPSRRWCAPASIPLDIDLVVCATATPDRTFPATAVRIQASSASSKGAAFDVAGRLLGLRLRAGDRRQLPQDRPVQARRRHRRRDLLAHSRLERPQHLRAVRRRRRRGGAGGAAAAFGAARIAASWRPASARMAASRTCSTSTAARARPRPSAICA